jgi:DNA (cytosine-5)-methyltransferase 1
LALQDVAALDASSLPEFDLLLAGFPCQPFSVAGSKRGFKDKGRGDLFFDIVRILEARRPTAIFLENVRNLAQHDHGRTFVIIKESLERLGYKIKFAILNSAEYGNVPQSRERIYIVGFKDPDAWEAFKFPEKKNLSKAISDVLEDKVDERYYYRKGWLYDRIKNAGMRPGAVYHWRRVYLREVKSGMAPTLTANMGMGGHNVPLIKDKKGMRRLTPKECARLQGFPAGYKLPKDIVDARLYKQIGNSVTVSVIERIAKNIQAALQGAKVKIKENGGRIHKKEEKRNYVANKVPQYSA